MQMHHAYYIEGPLALFGAYKDALQPFWAAEFERFGVDEARELIALASLKNFSNATFLLGAASITSEAQQAMLKLFEEPQQGTMFVMLLPHGVLLPTLRSRMLQYPETVEFPEQKSLARGRSAGLRETRGLFEREILQFLKSSGKARSDSVAALLKDDNGVKERVRSFVNALEAEVYKKNGAEARAALDDIAKVRSYLADRSPSLKMLLEHLAISLPTV